MKKISHCLLIVIFAFILSGCAISTPRPEASPTPLPTPVVPTKPLYTVERGEVISRLQFTGRVAPANQEEAFFEVDGRVRNIYFKRGDLVKAGQVIADLEILDNLERRLAMDNLDLRRVKAQVKIAEHLLEIARLNTPTSARMQESYQHELAIKELELKLTQIDLEAVKLGQQDLQAEIAAATLVAPMDGIVLTFYLKEGTEVKAYSSVLTVADVNQLEIIAELQDTDMSRLVEGMPVTVEPYNLPGETYEGVIQILPYPYGSGGTNPEAAKTVHVALQGGLEALDVELGDLMRVTLVLDRKEDTLWLPIQAVRIFEGRRFVVLQEGNIQRRVDVKLGIQGEDRIEILEGVSEGQVIVGP